MPDFINPYTFVGLRDGKSLCTVAAHDKKLTGKVTCRILTRTQLAIPDIADGQIPDGITRHPFYRVGGRAVIPGSSIRGVIRNVYESLTNSCMHINDKDDDYFSSRQNKQAPGLLCFEKGIFKLYEADRIRITLGLNAADSQKAKGDKNFRLKMIRLQNDQLKDFCIGDRVSCGMLASGQTSVHAEMIAKDPEGVGVFMRADLLMTGRNDKKNLNHNNPGVLIRKASFIQLDRDAVDLFYMNINAYSPTSKDIPTDLKEQYESCFKAMKKGEAWLPVWYYKRSGKLYLAPSQMSRSFFFNKPRHILERMNYAACTSKSCMCEACALFGMVGLGKNKEAVSSRVRFSDAVCDDPDCFDGYYVLPILGEPRISSFEFYLKKKSGRYDEMTDRRTAFIKAYDPDENDTVIAGRKFYWHHNGKKITSDDEKAVQIAREAIAKKKDNYLSKDNCLELVKADETFTTDIYFDGITEDQLKKLIFSLNLGENTDGSKLCHKLGRGKPVGLGSVKIVVDNVIIRDFIDGSYLLNEKVEDKYFAKAEELFDKAEYSQVLCVSKLDAVDAELIRYPVTPTGTSGKRNDDDAAFKWFAANRNNLTTTPGTIAFKRRLPDIMSPDQRLPQNIRSENRSQPIEQLQGEAGISAADSSFSSSIILRKRGQSIKPTQDKNSCIKKAKW